MIPGRARSTWVRSSIFEPVDGWNAGQPGTPVAPGREVVDRHLEHAARHLVPGDLAATERDQRGLVEARAVGQPGADLALVGREQRLFLRRREARFETLEAEEGGAGVEPRGPAAAAASAERERILGEVFSQLPPRERECFELHYLDGLTHRQIGERLGLPQDTVSTVLRRTKERLREILRQRGLEP